MKKNFVISLQWSDYSYREYIRRINIPNRCFDFCNLNHEEIQADRMNLKYARFVWRFLQKHDHCNLFSNTKIEYIK